MDNIENIIELFKKFLEKYETIVLLNPRLTTDIEGIIRWSSYLVATRKSPVLGELLSSGVNLIQLWNDILLRQANKNLKLNLQDHAVKLKTCLSVVQSLELLAEIYARDNHSKLGRWIIITVIQITKAVIKLTLLLVYDEGITKSQPIVQLDRSHYIEIQKLNAKYNIDDDQDQEEELDNEQQQNELQAGPSTLKGDNSTKKLVTLKSSGRKMRTISGAPPRGRRFSDKDSGLDGGSISNFQKQRLTVLLNRYRDQKSAKLNDMQFYGEVIHITRPIAHLMLMGAFGTQSWVSYLTSLIMDLSSLQLIRSPDPVAFNQPQQQYKFNINERIELGQRASSLLLYMLRSPFFDQYTKHRALEGISSAADSIPIVGRFLATFVNYIPEWQKDYFRVWSE